MPDFTRGYGVWEDIYDGECHPAITEADPHHRAQQDTGSAAIWRI